MALTTEEENVLKKIIEINTKRAEWTALNQAYAVQINQAKEAKEAELVSDKQAILSKYSEIKAAEEELNSLVVK